MMNEYFVRKLSNGEIEFINPNLGKQTARKLADFVIETKSVSMLMKIINNEVDIVEVTCYNTTNLMERQEAIAYYEEGMMECDGAEADRYAIIWGKLKCGSSKVSDDEDED